MIKVFIYEVSSKNEWEYYFSIYYLIAFGVFNLEGFLFLITMSFYAGMLLIPQTFTRIIITTLTTLYFCWSIVFFVIAAWYIESSYYIAIAAILTIVHVYLFFLVKDFSILENYKNSLLKIVEENAKVTVHKKQKLSIFNILFNRPTERIYILDKKVFSNEVCYIFSSRSPVVILSQDYKKLSGISSFLIQHELFHATLMTKIIDKRLGLFEANFFVMLMASSFFLNYGFISLVLGTYGVEKYYESEKKVHNNRAGFLEIIADFYAFQSISYLHESEFRHVVLWVARNRSREKSSDLVQWGKFLYSYAEKPILSNKGLVKLAYGYITQNDFVKLFIRKATMTLFGISCVLAIEVSFIYDFDLKYENRLASIVFLSPLIYWFFLREFYKSVKKSIMLMLEINYYEKLIIS